jgi:hypothetical protein
MSRDISYGYSSTVFHSKCRLMLQWQIVTSFFKSLFQRKENLTSLTGKVTEHTAPNTATEE